LRPTKKVHARKAAAGAKAAPPPVHNTTHGSFAASILKRAKEIVSEYQIIVTSEDGEWYGRGLEMPNVFGDGPTPAACVQNTRQALIATVAYMLEQNQTPPIPAKQGKRTTQVNVRLTAEEKAILEGTARRKGFEGLSDFLRAAALESAT
jgi:predicted RNase H-like HicB family nuclease